MIFFSDRYTEEIGKLRETLNCLDVDVKITVLEDHAFLASGIFLPYEYYIAKQSHEKHVEQELFYDSLPVPEYWEARDNGEHVGIYYMGRERAVVYFRERENRQLDVQERMESPDEVNASMVSGEGGNPDSTGNHEDGAGALIRVAENGKVISADTSERGIVQRVEWRMENGWIYRVDFYNKYGRKYASEFRDADGVVESRVFYSDGNQEVLVEQPGNDVVTLVEKGMVRGFFNSHAEFARHYLEEIRQNEKCVLFVQDEKMLETLDIKPDGEQAWDYACFPNEDLLNKYAGLGGRNGFRFYSIPRHYPENKAGREALILTMSDQIERIEDLTSELSEMTFHIAANTLVSDKLNRLGERENVNIYPCVSREKLDELWNRCDFYLDVNHWREIYDAVNVAHQNNLLIMGFENTLHHPELLVKGCKFLTQDYKKMVLVIKYVMRSPELMQKLLLVQQRKKKAIWKEILKEE